MTSNASEKNGRVHPHFCSNSVCLNIQDSLRRVSEDGLMRKFFYAYVFLEAESMFSIFSTEMQFFSRQDSQTITLANYSHRVLALKTHVPGHSTSICYLGVNHLTALYWTNNLNGWTVAVLGRLD